MAWPDGQPVGTWLRRTRWPAQDPPGTWCAWNSTYLGSILDPKWVVLYLQRVTFQDRQD